MRMAMVIFWNSSVLNKMSILGQAPKKKLYLRVQYFKMGLPYDSGAYCEDNSVKSWWGRRDQMAYM